MSKQDVHTSIIKIEVLLLTISPNSSPPIRACIFDMDGLLINSEDILTRCINTLLAKYDRPAITRHLRVQLMGVPDSTSSDLFHNWAQVPITRANFDRELKDEMKRQFTACEPMPGAKDLLTNLSRAQCSGTGQPIELALASTTTTSTYRLKTSRPETKALLHTFAGNKRILGDDSRIPPGRGKPAPDIYQIALRVLNSISGSESPRPPIQPNECLVFQDSIAGVEAGRRAGMRTV